ncbi:MAG: hypothetical protein WD397_13255 [Wenzhouxiangellaceae bacterium]
MPHWSLYLSLALLAFFVLAAAVWTATRLATPTAGQRAAMALLEQPGEFPGRNAFGLMYTANRLVPASEIDAVLAEEARRVEKYVADNPLDAEPIPEFAPGLDRYPALEVGPADAGLFCQAREPCLARVRADLPAYRKLVEIHSPLLDRLEQITTADHYRQPWPHSPVNIGISPAFGQLFHPATRHALRFAEGDVPGALEDACRALAGWRRIGANADATIVRLMANAYAGEGYAGLVADMLAELPPDEPLPTACDAALAPPEDAELMLCNAIRGEFALVDRYRDLVGAIPGGHSLVFDAEASAGLVAERYARLCSDKARQWIARDVATIETRESRLPWSWECIANFSGCILVSAVEDIHDGYALRMNDFGFRLKALATLVWLRGHMAAATSIQALLRQRPEALRSPTRDLRVSADGNALIVPLHHPGADAPARLPLPGHGARPASSASPSRPCPD